MKTRTKSAFVLLGTLALGLILGVMLQSAVQNQRSERMQSLRNRGALIDVILHVVEPQDEAQAEAIRAVVTRAEEAHGNILREYWEARSDVFDAMHEELVTNILSERQARELGKWRDRNRRSTRSGGQQGGNSHENERDDDRHNDGRREGDRRRYR